MTVIAVRKLEKAISQALFDWLSPQGFIAADGGGIERWQGNRYDFIGAVVNRVGGENHIRATQFVKLLDAAGQDLPAVVSGIFSWFRPGKNFQAATPDSEIVITCNKFMAAHLFDDHLPENLPVGRDFHLQ